MSRDHFSASKAAPHLGLYATLLALTLSCLMISACSEEASPTQITPESTQPVVHTYTLRGRIISLPEPSNPASELQIHHEAIDEFKSAQGEPAPMNAMTMSFPPATGVSLDGLVVGDAVEFVFRVQWEPTHEMGTTSIKKLPAETKLAFE